MKKLATLAAIALHLTLAAVLYATTTNPEYSAPPQDILLKAAAIDGNTFAIYKAGAECLIEGKYYKLEGDGYENIPFCTDFKDCSSVTISLFFDSTTFSSYSSSKDFLLKYLFSINRFFILVISIGLD